MISAAEHMLVLCFEIRRITQQPIAFQATEELNTHDKQEDPAGNIHTHSLRSGL